MQARRADRTLRVLTTRDRMVSMICEGLLDINDADSIKDEWAARHRFRLKLASFRKGCAPNGPALIVLHLGSCRLQQPSSRAEN